MFNHTNDNAKLDELQTIEAAENADQTGRPQLWERQAGESAKAFDAFRRYRDLAERRTLAKVAKELGCSSTNIERWARKWFWTNRVSAFDLVEEEKFREQTARDRMSMRRRQVQLGAACQGIAAYGIREYQSRIAAGQALNLGAQEIKDLLAIGSQLEGKGIGEAKDSRYTRIVVNFSGGHRYPGEACGCKCPACASCHGEGELMMTPALEAEYDDDPPKLS
jgi:hypothetical protein